jgi:methionyl-tRNA formyltransferase
MSLSPPLWRSRLGTASRVSLSRHLEILAAEPSLRIVTLGSDHPFTAAALKLVQDVGWIEHAGHVKTFDEREFLRDPDSERANVFLASLKPDLFLSSGYGRILHEETLAIPTIGAINVHPSILPRYRGYEAVAWALYEGESEIGITVHSMILPVDSGPILAQKAISVRKNDEPRAVYERLSALLPQVLGPVLEQICLTRTITGRAQPPGATFHSKPWHELAELELDWTLPAAEVARRARLFRGYCNVNVGRRRIFFRRVEHVAPQPGTICRRRPRALDVFVGDGQVLRLHLARPLRVWAKLALAGQLATPRLGGAAPEVAPTMVDDLLKAGRALAAAIGRASPRASQDSERPGACHVWLGVLSNLIAKWL